MLEKGYTLPILFGIFLGIIFAGVQISVVALDVAVDRQYTAPMFIESADHSGLDAQVLGKKIRINRPKEPFQAMETTSKEWKSIRSHWQEKVGSISQEFAKLKSRGEQKARDFYLHLMGLF